MCFADLKSLFPILVLLLLKLLEELCFGEVVVKEKQAVVKLERQDDCDFLTAVCCLRVVGKIIYAAKSYAIGKFTFFEICGGAPYLIHHHLHTRLPTICERTA